MKTIKTFLPIFPGFYGTIFNYENEEEDIEYYNEENKTDLNYSDFKFDYQGHNQRVSEKCVEVIERELQYHFPSIKIEFEELYSPKYYNYSNDVINVTITISNADFEEFIMYIGLTWSNEFKTYLKEHFTSTSGFTSFVENKSETWLNEYLKEDHERFAMCFEQSLQFILENEDFTTDDLYNGLDGETYIEFELIKKVQLIK